jgi:hypothetical protein
MFTGCRIEAVASQTLTAAILSEVEVALLAVGNYKRKAGTIVRFCSKAESPKS